MPPVKLNFQENSLLLESKNRENVTVSWAVEIGNKLAVNCQCYPSVETISLFRASSFNQLKSDNQVNQIPERYSAACGR